MRPSLTLLLVAACTTHSRAPAPPDEHVVPECAGATPMKYYYAPCQPEDHACGPEGKVVYCPDAGAAK